MKIANYLNISTLCMCVCRQDECVFGDGLSILCQKSIKNAHCAGEFHIDYIKMI